MHEKMHGSISENQSVFYSHFSNLRIAQKQMWNHLVHVIKPNIWFPGI